MAIWVESKTEKPSALVRKNRPVQAKKATRQSSHQIPCQKGMYLFLNPHLVWTQRNSEVSPSTVEITDSRQKALSFPCSPHTPIIVQSLGSWLAPVSLLGWAAAPSRTTISEDASLLIYLLPEVTLCHKREREDWIHVKTI